MKLTSCFSALALSTAMATITVAQASADATPSAGFTVAQTIGSDSSGTSGGSNGSVETTQDSTSGASTGNESGVTGTAPDVGVGDGSTSTTDPAGTASDTVPDLNTGTVGGGTIGSEPSSGSGATTGTGASDATTTEGSGGSTDTTGTAAGTNSQDQTASGFYVYRPGDLRASNLIGTPVQNSAGESIGKIKEIVLRNEGSVAAVIVGVGGFLGMGEREVALAFSSLQMIPGENGLGTATAPNLTTEAMVSAPDWSWSAGTSDAQ